MKANYVLASDVLGESKFLLEFVSSSDFVFGVNNSDSPSLIAAGDMIRWLKEIEDCVKNGVIKCEEIEKFGTRETVLAEVQRVIYRIQEIPDFDSVYIDLRW